MAELDRRALARYIIEYGSAPDEPTGREIVAMDDETLADGGLGLHFPTGTKPEAQPWPDDLHPDNPLPKADILVVTWTVAEHQALADVLTPGVNSRNWAPYRRNFQNKFKPHIRAGAPSLKADRLGSWCPTKIGDRSLVCVKSELHLNQDGIPTGTGTATSRQ